MIRMLERELEVLGIAERAAKRITGVLQCASSVWLSGFQFLGYDGKPCQTSSGMKDEGNKTELFNAKTSVFATEVNFMPIVHIASESPTRSQRMPPSYCSHE